MTFKHSPASRRLVTLLSATLLLACVAVQAEWPDKAPFTLEILDVLEQAKDITAEKYPEADTALLDDIEYTQYTPDGANVTWDDMAYKILTEKGKEQFKTVSIYYNASYSKAAIECLEIHKPGGRVVTPPLEKLTREMINPSQMDSNIYDPNNKIVTANIPGLEIGDIIRYRTRHETFKPRCPNTFCDTYALESDDYIHHYTIIVDAPPELPLKAIALRNPVKDTVSHSEEALPGGAMRHRWTAHAVPVMHPEPQMPSFRSVAQRLLISTVDDWKHISRWYWNLCQPHLKESPEMRAKVQELTKGLKSQDDIIRAVFRFVSQKIRYMGITIEDNAPGYEPHDVALTFANRHGVCRDKAALLAAMLNIAGIQAFPVLIMAGDKMDPDVPTPYFNHAITAALAPDGSYILMDSTDEQTKDLFPQYLADKSFLVARKEGDTLQTSPFSPFQDNLVTIDTTAAINDKGALAASSTLRFTGINDNAYRGTFANCSPDERREFIQNVLKKALPDARLLKLAFTPDDMLDTATPLAIRMDYECDSVFIANDAFAMLPTPSLASVFGMNNFIIRSTSLDARKYPFKTKYACGVSETIGIALDAAWGRPDATPDFTQSDDHGYSWTRTVKADDKGMTIKTDTALKLIEYSPEQYLTLKKHLQAREENQAKRFIFRHRKPEAVAETQNDVEILDDSVTYHLTSPSEWSSTQTLKYRVLTYKGKKDNAELSFSFLPATQSVAIEMARVTNTVKNQDGTETLKVQDASEKEKNLMDAPWVARAPRYPAMKKLVVSLPGVEIGSIIECKITRSFKEMMPFALQQTFRNVNAPVHRRSVTLSIPAHVKLTSAVFQNGLLANDFQTHQTNIAETFSTQNNRMLWTWTAQNQPPVPDESAMPPAELFTPAVFCSTATWPQIVGSIRKALEAKSIAGPHVRQTADEIRKLPEDKRPEAVNAIIARDVATAGPNFLKLPLDTLSTPETTLTEGYGHSADTAILAFTLLKELGYSPEYILLAPWPQRDDLFKAYIASPDADVFNMIRVRATINGKTLWFNDQNQYANLETATVDNCHAMTLDGHHATLSLPEKFKKHSATDFTITLEDNGNAAVAVSTGIFGSAFSDFGKTIKTFTPEYRRRFFLAKLQALSQKAKATSDLTADADAYPGRIAFSCDIPKFATLDGNFMYLELPVGLKAQACRILENRQTPMQHGSFNDIVVTYTIKLPPGFRPVMLPQPLDWRAPDQNGYESTCSITTASADDGIRLTYKAHMAPEIIRPEQFEKYRQIYRILTHPASTTLLLEKSSSNAR